jgi:hypothetical protein
MIYVTRTGSIAPGKALAAHEFAQKAASHWKTQWDRTLEIRRPIGGNPNRIAWVAQYKDLAEYEAATVKALSDPKYMDLLVTAGELFIPGSINDEIWKAV